ncbi:CopG family transcriptional regulator [Candidatus Gracilibacteria bacterium]|nr:CopG family transcriptional regulator [Candidatus Gracilibacteria bacterium]
MRTTVDLEEDVLLAAKELARQRGVSIGKVISDLARQALARPDGSNMRNGIPLFPVQPGAQLITLELVNLLRDELPGQPTCSMGTCYLP